jgi:anti-sigma regulatory factor (Ser/Thr protein kinase)
MPPGAFRHEAMPYSGTEEFVGLAVSFLARAVRDGEPALVLVDEAKQARLRDALGHAAASVAYGDVRIVGRNPAHIIPEWRSFVDNHAGHGALWGIGEPLWPGRSASEVAECHQHEALLNLALADAARLTLVCPIDVAALAPETVSAAVRCHPDVRTGGATQVNAAYAGVDPLALLSDPLPAAPRDAAVFRFTERNLRALRTHVAAAAAALGFGLHRTGDVVLAVDEVATNSYRYGGGGGTLRTWASGRGLVCEVRDGGRFSDPLVGRRRPSSDRIGGRGLWIANQLCDLVQVRSSGEGAVVRLYARPTP